MTRIRTQTCSHEETVEPRSDLGWLLVTGRNRLLAKLDHALAPLDLTAAQSGVLHGIARGIATTPATLCQLLDYDRGAMTRLLDRMEAKGLLVRLPNPADRRAIILELTAKGHSLYPKMQPKIDAVFDQALRDLDPDQAKTLVALLCRVVLNLE